MATGASYLNCYTALNISGGSGFSYTLNLRYDDALMGAAYENALKLARKDMGVNGTWQTYNTSTVNLGTNTLSNTGLTTSGEYTGIQQNTLQVCPGGYSVIPLYTSGSNYQWQVNAGSGFVNINDNTNYIGTQSNSLVIQNIPSLFYGYQYRCMIDGQYSPTTTIQIANYFTGSSGNAWERSC
jgi:hypothetical protein